MDINGIDTYGYKNSTRLMHEEIDAARNVLVWHAEPGSFISSDILMSYNVL